VYPPPPRRPLTDRRAVLAIGVIVLAWDIVTSVRRHEAVPPDPWGGYSLEWATTSPPPEFNFDSLPPIRSERPAWDMRHEHAEAAP